MTYGSEQRGKVTGILDTHIFASDYIAYNPQVFRITNSVYALCFSRAASIGIISFSLNSVGEFTEIETKYISVYNSGLFTLLGSNTIIISCDYASAKHLLSIKVDDSGVIGDVLSNHTIGTGSFLSTDVYRVRPVGSTAVALTAGVSYLVEASTFYALYVLTFTVSGAGVIAAADSYVARSGDTHWIKGLIGFARDNYYIISVTRYQESGYNDYYMGFKVVSIGSSGDIAYISTFASEYLGFHQEQGLAAMPLIREGMIWFAYQYRFTITGDEYKANRYLVDADGAVSILSGNAVEGGNIYLVQYNSYSDQWFKAAEIEKGLVVAYGSELDRADAFVFEYDSDGVPPYRNWDTDIKMEAVTGHRGDCCLGYDYGMFVCVYERSSSDYGIVAKTIDYVTLESEPVYYPSVASIRVSGIIHRWEPGDRNFNMEVSLGGVTTDFGIPQIGKVQPAIPPTPPTPPMPIVRTPYRCPICGLYFATEAELSHHIALTHLTVPLLGD